MIASRFLSIILLVPVITLSGCSQSSETDAGAIGETIGQNVTEFAKGVGTGIDTELQVSVEVSSELREAGFTYTIAKQKTSIEHPEKAITVYFTSTQAINCTLIAKAHNSENLEIGRAATDVQFVQDDAQYITFTFPPEMDSQLVEVYRISKKPSETDEH